ncbi:MAG: hypothetical protein NT116_00470, partial [Candidatus Parcubacteria bacterium]|nr:hypothetical protein [Candidatus Parcubacteria bacterium]
MQKKSIFTLISLIFVCQFIFLPLAVSADDVVNQQTVISDTNTTDQTLASIDISQDSLGSGDFSQDSTLVGNGESDSAIIDIKADTSLSADDSANEAENVTVDSTGSDNSADGTLVSNETSADNNNVSQEALPQASEPVVEPLVEAVPVVPYQLPHNPLCAGITGDLNGDGLINVYDEEVIKKMIAGLETFSPCADFGQDGYVGPDDLSRLKITYVMDMPRWGVVLQPKNLNLDSAATSFGESSCTLGDANGDNLIDYKDEGLIIQMVAGIIPQTISADLDGDGYVSPGDVSKIKIATLFTHAESAEITAKEKGNCNVPTAEILYSTDGGGTYTSSAEVKNGDTLTIKVVFSKPLNQFEVSDLNIDNGLAFER